MKELTVLHRSLPIFHIVKHSFGVQKALLELKALHSPLVLHDLQGIKHFRVLIEDSARDKLLHLVRRNALEVGGRYILNERKAQCQIH